MPRTKAKYTTHINEMQGRIPPISNSLDKIQLDRLAHVSFAHPDLETFDAFAHAFGFEVAHRSEKAIYYRGWGKDAFVYAAHKQQKEARFLGATFVASSEQDFQKCAGLPTASPVRDNVEGPGGGKIVSLSSPSGTMIHILWGQEDRPVPERSVSATEVYKGGYNTSLKKERKGESFISSMG